jgi:hypothetical protein
MRARKGTREAIPRHGARPESCRRVRTSIGHGLKTLASLVEDAVRCFPDDRELLREHSRFVLASGPSDRAEAIVQRVEAAEDDHF